MPEAKDQAHALPLATRDRLAASLAHTLILIEQDDGPAVCEQIARLMIAMGAAAVRRIKGHEEAAETLYRAADALATEQLFR